MTRPVKLKYRFNQLGLNKHQLFIYDDVTAYGSFNWSTWEYDDSETSADYFRQKLSEIPDTDEIELYVNSYGGSVKEGVAIYNMLKRKLCKKTCYIDGFAYSVASVICLACDKIIMGLGTSMMIHDMWVTCSGNAKELRKQADDLDILMESNRKIYLDRAKNLTEEELIEMMEKETILTPEMCLEYGFCDEITDTKVDETQLLQSEKVRLLQMKKDILMQKSLRQEYLDFIQSSKKNGDEKVKSESEEDEEKDDDIDNSNDEKDDKELEQNYTSSFFNAISKIKF